MNNENGTNLKQSKRERANRQLISPILTYAVASWVTPKEKVERIPRITERRIIRNITRLYGRADLRYYPNTLLYQKSRIMPIGGVLIRHLWRKRSGEVNSPPRTPFGVGKKPSFIQPIMYK